MFNNTSNTKMIQQLYCEYKNKYKLYLPNIQYIEYTNTDNFWARFATENLYNKKYVLYINPDLLSKNKKFLKQILYHEFTHLADSLQFLDRTLKEYKNIMASYSEFHASKREMVERIEEIENNDIDLQTEIVHAGILTIDSFIKQSYVLMINDLEKMSKNNDMNNFFFDTNHVYYFYGYISALKDFGIQYQIDTYKLPIDFNLQIMEIQKKSFK